MKFLGALVSSFGATATAFGSLGDPNLGDSNLRGAGDYGHGGRRRHRGRRGHWGRRGWGPNWWVASSPWMADLPWDAEAQCYRTPAGGVYCPPAVVGAGAAGNVVQLPAGVRVPLAGPGAPAGAPVHVPGVEDQRVKFDEGPPWPSKTFHVPAWYRKSDKGKVALLRKYAKEYGRDPRLRAFVVKHVLEPSGALFPSRQFEAQAKAILAWTQNNIAYLNEPGELLQSPWQTLKVKHGDCDDMAILMAAMAESIALPCRFVLAGRTKVGGRAVRWAEGQRFPGGCSFFHIYCQFGWPAFRPTTWASAEPTMKVPLGHDVTVHGVPKEMGELSGPGGPLAGFGGAWGGEEEDADGGLTRSLLARGSNLIARVPAVTEIVEWVPDPVKSWSTKVFIAALVAIPVQLIVLKVLGAKNVRRWFKLD